MKECEGRKPPSNSTRVIQNKGNIYRKIAGQSHYLSVITLNVNGLNIPIKKIDWLNGLKDKIHVYDAY